MIIPQIDIEYVPPIKSENDPPIAGNVNGMESTQIAGKLVEAVAGPSQVLDRVGGIKIG